MSEAGWYVRASAIRSNTRSTSSRVLSRLMVMLISSCPPYSPLSELTVNVMFSFSMRYTPRCLQVLRKVKPGQVHVWRPVGSVVTTYVLPLLPATVLVVALMAGDGSGCTQTNCWTLVDSGSRELFGIMVDPTSTFVMVPAMIWRPPRG